MKRCFAAALAMMLPGLASADALLALPGETGINFWRTAPGGSELVFEGLQGGVAGRCYALEKASNRLKIAEDSTACLSYLLRDGPIQTSGAPAYDITGTVTALNDTPGDGRSAFAITGVRGVDNCGERGNCDTIFVRGVTSKAALAAFSAAAVSGKPVRVSGPGVWHLESIDIVIDDIK